MSKLITIFTPTYNRANFLPRLYESLKRQTRKDFVWLVVDDGSIDNTRDLIKSWMGEHIIDIRYIFKENGGKMRAHNVGVQECETELFMCLDSDDYLTDNALERVVYWESTISGEPMFMGVVGNRGTTETYSPNRPLGAPYKDCNVFV